MKKLLITLIGSFALAGTLPAFAGPDWQIIEKARDWLFFQLRAWL